ncbi:MAG: sulfotransferase domain-containing protein, partial [Candidatus Binatia bacterium]
PCIAPAFLKEVHFFESKHFHKGTLWYRTYFPSVLSKYLMQIRQKAFITGEATAYYIFHPHAPKRIRQTLPDVKLIALLRNPVDRAYSHYHHEVRKGREPLPFADAVEKEAERLQGEKEKMLADDHYESHNYHHYSYLSRGIYVDQLQVWTALFPKEQILILRSEDLYTDPARVLRQAFDFLGLPRWDLPAYKNFNDADYTEMDAGVRKHVADYFAPHNRRLYEFLGRDFAWEK